MTLGWDMSPRPASQGDLDLCPPSEGVVAVVDGRSVSLAGGREAEDADGRDWEEAAISTMTPEAESCAALLSAGPGWAVDCLGSPSAMSVLDDRAGEPLTGWDKLRKGLLSDTCLLDPPVADSDKLMAALCGAALEGRSRRGAESSREIKGSRRGVRGSADWVRMRDCRPWWDAQRRPLTSSPRLFSGRVDSDRFRGSFCPTPLLPPSWLSLDLGNTVARARPNKSSRRELG